MISFNINSIKTNLKKYFLTPDVSSRRSGINPLRGLLTIPIMFGFYGLILLSGNEEMIQLFQPTFDVMIWAIGIIVAGFAIIMLGIFLSLGIFVLFSKLKTMKRKLSSIIKSPQNIEILEEELKNMGHPKTEFLNLKSILSELLTRVKNIQEEVIPENIERMDKLEIKNHDLTVENKKLQKDIVIITKELIQIKQSIHQNNEGT